MTDAALMLATEPLWACLFGVLLLHDLLGAADFAGGALIILALLVNEGVVGAADTAEAK